MGLKTFSHPTRAIKQAASLEDRHCITCDRGRGGGGEGVIVGEGVIDGGLEYIRERG